MAGPAIAADPAPTPAAPAPLNPNKRICRVDTATGSIIERRICHTRAEWVEIDRQNARTVTPWENKRTDPPPPPG